jgi:hypothetical protein
MKQTAAEWFAKELESYGDPQFCEIEWEQLDSLMQQAKEMEKEQIIESYCQGCFDISKDENIFPRETSEQYYNETYKSEQ